MASKDHVAIMRKSWKMIPKILSGQKTIESRWYMTRRPPWDMISVGDRVYFKNSGESVIAWAKVCKVMQFELKDILDAQRIAKKYGKRICLADPDPKDWDATPKYCILVFLKDAKSIKKPFNIDKSGYGMGAAWMVVKSIR